MKNNKKTPPKDKKHGVISVIQSGETGAKKTENAYESSKKKKHGVISIVQAPSHKKV
jgi:ASC-1-like (ASCH) protein